MQILTASPAASIKTLTLSFNSQVLETVIFLANAAARNMRTSGHSCWDQSEAVYGQMMVSLTIVHYQLERHRAPASAAQLQVSGCCDSFAAARRSLPAPVPALHSCDSRMLHAHHLDTNMCTQGFEFTA